MTVLLLLLETTNMIRFAAVPVLLVLAVPVRGAPPEKEPDNDQINVFTKVFLGTMGKHHGDKNANALREFIDPNYLTQHKLTDADLAAQMAPVWGTRRYDIADDRRTVLCFVETKSGSDPIVKEAILLRLSVHEGKVYLLPAKAPDAKTGSFVPWILRTKLPG
jgi:hypothetical protein